MKVYLIRAGRAGSARDTYLVPEDELRVSYPEKHRTVRTMQGPLGPMREVAGTGEFDRGQFEMSARQDGERKTTVANGQRAPFRHYRVRRPDLKQHVRVLADQDVAAIAGYDSQIDELRRRMQDVRAKRAEHVKASWRRARPANSLDLSDLADAKLADIEEARRG